MNAQLVYTGAYLVRNIEQVQDYTNYARGVFGYYYQCAGYSPTNPAAGKCYTPSTSWVDKEKNTHETHEIRLSTPDEWRLRAIGGVFYEKYVIEDDTEWQYKTVPTCSPTLDVDCFNNVAPFAGTYTSNPQAADY
jgi:iron complex outermembrane recepter protein